MRGKLINKKQVKVLLHEGRLTKREAIQRIESIARGRKLTEQE